MANRKVARLFSLVAPLLLLLCTSLAVADRVVPSDEVQNSVTVRNQGAIVGRLVPGESALLVSTAGQSHKVRLDNGVEGYVSRRWTRVVPDAQPVGRLAIHFIDVGQGDSTLVICPDGSTILVDSGSLSGMEPEPVRDYITEVLGPGDNRIDHLVVTHADQDHYNLLPEVTRGFTIGHVYFVGDQDHYYEYFWTWLTGIPNERRTRLVETDFNPQGSPHPSIDCGPAEVFVLAAAVQSNDSWKNAMSIVLMLRFGNFEAILTGDATHATENAILARYPVAFLEVDLLKIGHHGSLATSTSVAWANTLQPRIAVASAAARSQYGHPRSEVIERLTPHTLNDAARAHAFSSATRPHSSYVWADLTNYDELIYGTAQGGNIMVESDGSNPFTISTRLHGSF